MDDLLSAPANLIPRHPEDLEEFFVVMIEEQTTETGVSFSAILSDSVHEFGIENNGDGTENEYHCFYPESDALLERFRKVAEKSYPGSTDPCDRAVMWLEIRDLLRAQQSGLANPGTDR